MPVMEHLVELQVRLTHAVIVTAIVFVGTFFLPTRWSSGSESAAEHVCAGIALLDSDRPSHRSSSFLHRRSPLAKRQSRGVVRAGVGAYILVEFWHFVVPGFTPRSGDSLAVCDPEYPGLLSRAVVLLLFVLPFALNFLISYGVNAGFIPQLSIAQYVGFALWFLLVFGLILKCRSSSPCWPSLAGWMPCC